MRSVWGRRDSEGPLLVSCNRFGQAEDRNGQTLSSFIGSMIRDGKIAPLTYESWHKVPIELKEKMWSIAKVIYHYCNNLASVFYIRSLICLMILVYGRENIIFKNPPKSGQ